MSSSQKLTRNIIFSTPNQEQHLSSSVSSGSWLSDRLCVSGCPRGFWGDRRRCKRCYASCESCTGSRSDQCTSCQPGHHLTEGTNTCTAICGENYYLDHGWFCFVKFFVIKLMRQKKQILDWVTEERFECSCTNE